MTAAGDTQQGSDTKRRPLLATLRVIAVTHRAGRVGLNQMQHHHPDACGQKCPREPVRLRAHAGLPKAAGLDQSGRVSPHL